MNKQKRVILYSLIVALTLIGSLTFGNLSTAMASHHLLPPGSSVTFDYPYTTINTRVWVHDGNNLLVNTDDSWQWLMYDDIIANCSTATHRTMCMSDVAPDTIIHVYKIGVNWAGTAIYQANLIRGPVPHFGTLFLYVPVVGDAYWATS